MTSSPEPADAVEPLDALVASAHETPVIVVGAGIAGLVAALECAKVGMPVTVLEASDRLGGVIETIDLAGIRVDAGAQGYATRGGAIRELVRDLGLADRTLPVSPRALWLSGLPAGPAPLPEGGVAGIPDNAWDEGVRRIIGWRGAWRAYLDRLAPPLTIGQERSLGVLVRRRMGARVLDRLVAPISWGAFAIHPDAVDVEGAAPGLSAALTRTGSLAGGVAQLRGQRTGSSGPPLESIEGGMSVLIESLVERLAARGADIRTNSPVTSLQQLPDGRWQVMAANQDAAAAEPPIASANIVIIAAPEAEARQLLSAVVPAVDPAPVGVADLDVVTMVVDSAELTAGPRRTEVYPLAGAGSAAAVAHLSAQWPALRAAAGGDRHVLRVTFGGAGSAPATADLDDDGAVAAALTAASEALSVPLDGATLRAAHRRRYAQPQPMSALGQPSRAADTRAAIHAAPGLAAVGAWLAGTGIAQVVPDAAAEAERVRRAVLWNDAG